MRRLEIKVVYGMLFFLKTDIGQNQVLPGGERTEHGDKLKGANHAHGDPAVRRGMGYILARKIHLALIGDEKPGEKVEKGRFARAVGANDPGHLALLHVKIHFVHGHQPAETLG